MMRGLQGFFRLPTPYDPLAPLERCHPLLLRELNRWQGWTPQRTFANHYYSLTQFAVVIHLLTMGLLFSQTSVAWQSVLFVALPTLLVSTGAEILTGARTVFVWQTAGQSEAVDVLRLTMRDDEELLTTYEVIGTIHAWAGYQFDLTMRILPTVLVGGIGGAIAIGGVVSSPFMLSYPLQVVMLIALGTCLMRLAILFVSDPTWRFRTTVMWSLWCAVSLPDTSLALTAAVMGGLGARLIHLGGLLSLALVLGSYVFTGVLIGPEANHGLLILVFVGLAVGLPVFTRWGYIRLYSWLARRVLLALRQGT